MEFEQPLHDTGGPCRRHEKVLGWLALSLDGNDASDYCAGDYGSSFPRRKELLHAALVSLSMARGCWTAATLLGMGLFLPGFAERACGRSGMDPVPRPERIGS